MVSSYSLKLLRKEKIAKSVWGFSLERPKNFTFLPGQYIRIFAPQLGENVFRDFSITSIPSDKEKITIAVKHGISDYKKNLFSISVGSELSVEAPLGRFYLQENEKHSLVFLAGGVGIAPFYSMIGDLTQNKKQISLTLFASFSTVEDILFANELKSMQTANKNLQVVHTITQKEKSLKKWNGETQRISKDLFKKYIPDLSNPKFLISGSPSFVSDMESLLLQLEVELEKIRTEIFLGFY